MPKRNWMLLVYSCKNQFLAYYKSQKNNLGIWEYNDVQRKICKGDILVKIPECHI